MLSIPYFHPKIGREFPLCRLVFDSLQGRHDLHLNQHALGECLHCHA